MYICPNCHKVSETPAAFCAACGTAMIEQPAPAPQAPAYTAQPTYAYQQPQQPVYQQAPQQPTYQQPTYQQPPQQYWQQPTAYSAPTVPAPAQEGPSKGKVIVGMVLGIAGLAMASIGLLYTLALSFDAIGGFVFGFVFSMFSTPLSLVGMIMSNGNISAGDTSSMSSIGKKLGLIGLILSVVMLLIAIGSIGGESPYYF